MLELTNRAMLKPLADLDRLSRKLMRLADTIRFASYGYGGLFANIPVDEQKLAELYEYDLTLHQEIEELAVAVSTLKERRDDDWQKDSLEDVQQVLNRLEERIEKRQSVFTQN
jgi:acyl-CoA reductase-like NAD-dependent aldehyde dehydrogenase